MIQHIVACYNKIMTSNMSVFISLTAFISQFRFVVDNKIKIIICSHIKGANQINMLICRNYCSDYFPSRLSLLCYTSLFFLVNMISELKNKQINKKKH